MSVWFAPKTPEANFSQGEAIPAGEFQLRLAEATAAAEQSTKGYINAATLLPRRADPCPACVTGHFCVTGPDRSNEEAAPPQRLSLFAGKLRDMHLLP